MEYWQIERIYNELKNDNGFIEVVDKLAIENNRKFSVVLDHITDKKGKPNKEFLNDLQYDFEQENEYSIWFIFRKINLQNKKRYPVIHGDLYKILTTHNRAVGRAINEV